MVSSPAPRSPLVPSLPLIVVAAMLSGCDASKGSLLAPTDANITLDASATLLQVNSTASIEVSAAQGDGSPVEDGTEVFVNATMGSLNQAKVRTLGGQALVTFRAGAVPGLARIEASSAGARAAVEIPVLSSVPTKAQMTASPAQLAPGGGQTTVTLKVTDPGNQPVSGVPITLRTTGGTFNPSGTITSDAQGVAKATLNTTESVTVSAHILEIRVARLDVNVRLSVDLSLSMKPDKPREDQEVTFTIKPSDPDITGEWSMNFGDGTSKNLGSHKGTVTAAHTYSRAGGFNATARFKPSGADEVRQTIRVTVRSRVARADSGASTRARA